MVKIHPDLKRFVRPSEHSLFSPSSTDRWVACPFSVEYTRHTHVPAGPWAEEGTLAHSVCEAVFGEQYLGIAWPPDIAIQFSMLKEDAQVEMLSCANGYVDVITAWLKNHDHLGDILWYGLERGVPIFPDQDCFGTADFIAVGTKGVLVLDFKYGRGKNVSANSEQLRSYLGGVLRYLIDIPSDYAFHAVIYQPRTDIAPKHHEYVAHDLSKHLDIVWNAIQQSKRTDLQPCEGAHCHWCPANQTKEREKICPIKTERPEKMFKEGLETYMAQLQVPVANLTDANPKRDEALLKLITFRPLINKIADEAIEELTDRILKGEHIEGAQVVQTVGNRKWMFDDEKDIVKMIEAHFPQVEPYKTKKSVVSITDVEKLVGKGKCDTLTVKPVTKSLQILDDRQNAILGALSNFAKQLK